MLYYEGKEVIRAKKTGDIKLDEAGWELLTTEIGTRAVNKRHSVTFWYDDPFDAIREAITVQRRYIPKGT